MIWHLNSYGDGNEPDVMIEKVTRIYINGTELDHDIQHIVIDAVKGGHKIGAIKVLRKFYPDLLMPQARDICDALV